MTDSLRSIGTGIGDVDRLANRVIETLCNRQIKTETGVRKFVMDYLLQAIQNAHDFHPAEVLFELHGYRLSPDDVIDTYVPCAARVLGEKWISDELGFAQVTIGALRLQSLLGVASAESMAQHYAHQSEYTALVAVLEGEQHFLGAHVAAAQLRRLGVAVSLSLCEDEKTLLTKVELDQPDMVLLSCARIEALDAISRTVKKIRAAKVTAPVLALGGALKTEEAGTRQKTGVDIVTNTARDVLGFCAKRKQALIGK